MRDASYLIALFGLIFLGISLFAWLRIIRKSDRQRATKKGLRRTELAAMAVVIAFVLSFAAASVGVVGWIFK
jgi:hypothetical protein